MSAAELALTPIAPWLRPMLWRERDWGRALTRIAAAVAASGPDSARRAGDLGRALEHIVPDRRRAVVAYATGGGVDELVRAGAIAAAIGWWPAAARMAGAARALGGDPRLAVDELWAWLDAGEPMLAATVAAAATAAAPEDPWLERIAAVVRGRAEAGAEAAHAAAQAGEDVAGLLASSRLHRLAGAPDEARARLRDAIARAPHHPRVATLWLDGITDDAELPAAVHAQLADREPAAWVATAHGLGLRLIERPGARGLGLRLLEAALTTAYQHHLTPSAHLAIWTALTEHAASAGQRPRLMALAAAGLDATTAPDDRLWLAALGAEIAWRDADAVEVARAWAAVVGEHAPDHPLLAELAHVPTVTDDDGLVYLDGGGAAATARDLSPVRTALDALRQAVVAAETPAAVDIDTTDLIEPTPAPPAAVEVLTAAVDAVAVAVAAVDAAPAPSLIPSAARSALGRLPGRLPPLPPIAPPPNSVPRAPRVAVPLDATVERVGHPSLSVVCRDVSTTGMFILTDAMLALASTIDLIVHAPGDEAWTQHRHTVAARVVRRDPTGYGLELIDPSPALRADLARLTAQP